MSSPIDLASQLADISATISQAEAVLDLIAGDSAGGATIDGAIYGAATIIRAAAHDLGVIEIAARHADITLQPAAAEGRGATSDSAATMREAWREAFRQFDVARTEWQRFCHETYDPAAAARSANQSLPPGVGQRCDDLCNAFTDAGWSMLKVPAPDVVALSAKLHWLFDDVEPGEYSDGYPAEYVFAVLADARSLAGAVA